MCGQRSTGTADLLPDWFQDCAVKGTSESFQLTIIRKCIMSRYYYEDADIPLTAPLLKMIRKRLPYILPLELLILVTYV